MRTLPRIEVDVPEGVTPEDYIAIRDERDALKQCLLWLVRLKIVKDKIDDGVLSGKAEKDYLRDKPKAWAKARKLVRR